MVEGGDAEGGDGLLPRKGGALGLGEAVIGKDEGAGLDGAEEFGQATEIGAVAAHHEDIGAEVGAGGEEGFFGGKADVAGEEDAEAAVVKAEDEGAVVGDSGGWGGERPEDFEV